MKQIVRLAVLAGAAYLLMRYWEGGQRRRGARVADATGDSDVERDFHREALAPLGGLRATTAGQVPVPVAAE